MILTLFLLSVIYDISVYIELCTRMGQVSFEFELDLI